MRLIPGSIGPHKRADQERRRTNLNGSCRAARKPRNEKYRRKRESGSGECVHAVGVVGKQGVGKDGKDSSRKQSGTFQPVLANQRKRTRKSEQSNHWEKVRQIKQNAFEQCRGC